MARTRFDEAFYDRYYRDPQTRVGSAAGLETLGAFVCSYLKYLGIEVETALDVGCGVGLWRSPLEAFFPGLRYHGIEVSEHLCHEHGWTHATAEDYDHGEVVDLVICQGVLQYLPAPAARRAIDNLAAHTGEALYLEALTREDWEENCDRETTDGDVYLRSAAWYRAALAKHFMSCGGGLFLPRDSGAVLFELEKASI